MKRMCVFNSLMVMGFIAFVAILDAGSVRLVNDSPYKLRAVIRGSDGSFLGEVVINPQSENAWNDGYGGLPSGQDITRAQTPYTVLWYCLEGDPYSMCTPVATGSTVTAQGCEGIRECRPQQQRRPEEQSAPYVPLSNETHP
jgi:hypothetical protein